MCLNSSGCGHRSANAGQCNCGGNGHGQGALHLREATVDDIPVLLALISELAAYEGLQHECEVSPPLLAKHLFGPGAFAKALLAHKGQAVAGFAVWFPTYSTFLGKPGGFLEDLYVRPPFRKQGIGRELLIAVAHQALASGCARLEWRALKWNDSALSFYRKLGAEPLSEWLTLRLDAAHLFELPTQAKILTDSNPSNT